MTSTPTPLIAWLLATLSMGVAIEAHGVEQRPVSMTLQSVTSTNGPWQTDYWQVVVFVVTNAGAKPVHLNSCGASFIPTNIPIPLGLFGRCDVPPFTNSTLTVLWKPYHSETQWFRYAVFEQPGVIWKATTTARAIEAGVLGKRPLSLPHVWSTNGWVAAYEITSPPIAGAPEPPFPAGEGAPFPASAGGLDLIKDGLMTPGMPSPPPPEN
jgi:hypothetical protein